MCQWVGCNPHQQFAMTDDPFNLSDPFRASDHDPIVVGLDLTVPVEMPAMRPWHRALLGVLLFVLGTGVFGTRSRSREARARCS